MAPMASAVEETAGPDAVGRRLAFEFDLNLAAQHIEGLILTSMRVRWRARARRNHVFPEREGSRRLSAGGLVDMSDAENIERRTGRRFANERFHCHGFCIHRRSPSWFG